MKNLLISAFASLLIFSMQLSLKAQNKVTWPKGKKMALSLTFDDGRGSQVNGGTALLDKYGVKATLYVMPNAIEKNVALWKKAAENGHEIGNHSSLHPCSGNFAWSRNKALEEYTLEKMQKELVESNEQLHQMIGIKPESFAYPCGQKFVGNNEKTQSYVPLVYQLFSSGRGWRDEAPNDPAYLNMAQLTGVEMDGKNFDEILPMIKEASEKGYWLVLAGHEMGKGANQTNRLSMLEDLIRYAQDPQHGIWIAPVREVTKYLKH
jgi:peptidoglycan/xylan/chitin deacetylase (PgdA/CDA1 family)